MTATEGSEPKTEGFAPKILVFSTNNISDPGIDLAGSSHLHYSPTVMVISMPCTSGIRPDWILYAVEQGFDGVFIASDGEECAFLPDCAERSAQIMTDAQALLQERGHEPQRVKMAAVCSVCADPFVNYMAEFSKALVGARAVERRAGAGPRHRPAGPGAIRGACRMKYDALVIGSGISGMESALKLGDMGYKVLVVEKEASVGGKMILLSKVFPTLDCASCISTPKMGATIHHPNLTVLTYSEVESIERENGGFRAKIKQKPRFVDQAACTGCRQCEMVCKRGGARPVQRRPGLAPGRLHRVPASGSQEGRHRTRGHLPLHLHAARRASRPTATWRSSAAASTRRPSNSSPTPPRLVGSLGRACYAPCESECTRASLEGPVNIRRIKRFLADTHYAQPRVAPEIPAPNGKKVAIIGSGPAGLTAAWHLARKGYEVKIFEAAPLPGGMLRLALPPYRLPGEVVDEDVANVTDIGVTIATDARVEDLEALEAGGLRRHPGGDRDPSGHQAASSRRGPRRASRAPPTSSGPPSWASRSKWRASEWWSSAAATSPSTRPAPRSASRRRRCRSLSLESLQEMPAHPWEIAEAKAEGVTFRHSCGVRDFDGEGHGPEDRSACTACRCSTSRAASVPSTPTNAPAAIECDLVIVAAGMRPDAGEFGLPINPSGTIKVDSETLQTDIPYVFAAGDVVAGPTMITTAAGLGRRAAYMMDRWLQGEAMDPYGPRHPAPHGRQGRRPWRGRRLPRHHADGSARGIVKLKPGEFYPDEQTLTEEEALFVRQPLPRLRRLLRVQLLCGHLPGRLHRPEHEGAGASRPR